MPVPPSLSDYLRLCGGQHNKVYVGISLMLAYFIKCPSFSSLYVLVTT